MSAARFRLTAARLTPGGRGAIATIRVQARPAKGSLLKPDEVPNLFAAVDSLFVAANGQPFSRQELQKIAFGKWGSVDGEDLVICRLKWDSIEIYCHGGDAAVRRVLQDLEAVGCKMLSWIDQVSLTSDLVDVECLEVLSRTTTWRTTRIALEQSNGVLKTAFAQLQSAHDANDATVEQQIDTLLAWAQFGLHLAAPWNVVLTGRPNVGKSSLINQLLGYERAIVFDQPGTTRDVVTGETAFDGWPVMLADTAGIRNDAGSLEAAGIALARQRLLAADLQIVVIDLSQAPSREDELLLQAWPQAIVVGNKVDLGDQWVDRWPASALRISSVTGEGLVELQRQLVQKLVPRVPAEGTAIPISSRQIQRLREAKNANSREQRGTAIARLINEVRDERH